MTETERLCSDCDRIVAFVVPACDDGQDEGDLMCVVCGAAVTTAAWQALAA